MIFKVNYSKDKSNKSSELIINTKDINFFDYDKNNNLLIINYVNDEEIHFNCNKKEFKIIFDKISSIPEEYKNNFKSIETKDETILFNTLNFKYYTVNNSNNINIVGLSFITYNASAYCDILIEDEKQLNQIKYDLFTILRDA